MAFLPFCTSSASRLLHSLRKMLAPVRLPSPPHTHRLVMPFFTRLKAAASLPSRVVKALQRALPITVPPCSHITNQIKTNRTLQKCHAKMTDMFLLALAPDGIVRYIRHLRWKCQIRSNVSGDTGNRSRPQAVTRDIFVMHFDAACGLQSTSNTTAVPNTRGHKINLRGREIIIRVGNTGKQQYFL